MPAVKRRRVRLYHKKSRNGCRRCKDRRVKCDEVKPCCGDCKRHSVPCTYDDPPPLPKDLGDLAAAESSSSPPLLSTGGFENGSVGNDVNAAQVGFDIRESKTRRLSELRLYHNYVTNVSQPFPVEQNPKHVYVMRTELPKLALEHDNLLYALYSLSASHLIHSEPQNANFVAIRQNYLGLALSEQRKAVTNLSAVNADAVFLASTLIVVTTFAMLQERSLEPYSPPTEWLQMGKGAMTVLQTASNIAGQQENGFTKVFTDSPPQLGEEDLFCEDNRKRYLILLNPGFDSEDLQNPDTLDAYEKALSYIGSIQAGIDNGEPAFALCRRLIAFSFFVPAKFIGLVEECRPRALVVLAHFFAVCSQVDGPWWLGHTTEREVLGVSHSIPTKWQGHMTWPLAMIQGCIKRS